MCLAVPGTIVELPEAAAFDPEQPGTAMGKVSFGGIVKDICLSFVPDVALGDYVVVHAGFAISQVDEAEAQQVLQWLEEMGQLEEELGAPPKSI